MMNKSQKTVTSRSLRTPRQPIFQLLMALLIASSGMIMQARAQTPPNAPTSVTATGGVNSAHISFTVPSSNGGATITNYEYSTNNGSSWTALEPARTDRTFTITGLTSCTAYDVKVRAVNSAGSGTASSAVSVTPRNGQSGGINWTSRAHAGTNNWRSVTYGNGVFVATPWSGQGSKVMTSSDGISWTSSNSTGDNTWTSVTYGKGLFVAVANNGSGNRVMTSPDGITWTSNSGGGSNNWGGVTYGNGVFVAVAGNGSVMTSPDGSTWTSRTAAKAYDWSSVTYGNGLFVAVAWNGSAAGNRVMTSPNGTDWTSQTSAADNNWTSVTYGNGLFVAVSSNGTNQVMTSTNGTTWMSRSAAESNPWQSVTYGNGLFVAVSSNGTNRVMTSTNGTTWTAKAAAVTSNWYGVAYGNGLFVAVSSDGGGHRAMSSTEVFTPCTPNAPTALSASAGVGGANISFTAPSNDGGAAITNYEYSTNNGTSWTAVSPASTNTSFTITGLTNCTAYDLKVRAVNSVGSGSASTSVSVTPQNGVQGGINWTSRTSAADNQWTSVTYGNGLFVAVSSTGTGNRVMTSPDGITWTSRTSAADNAWQSVTYGNGLFVAVSKDGTNRVMTSPDGITWTSRTSAANNYWRSVTYGNGLFVAVADNGTNRVMTSPDGITWTSRSAAAANLWFAVTYGNGLFVAVAWSNVTVNTVMTSPDGINWTSRASAADNSWQSVTYGNGLFVATAQTGTGNRVMTSPDGYTWTSRTSAADHNWYGVTYGNGLFVAVANNGSVMTSPNGITWTSRTSAVNNQWPSVTYGNGLFVAVSLNGTGNRVMTSSDLFAPGIPTINSITPRATQMIMSFTAPSSTGATAISNYEYSVDNGSTWVTPSPEVTSSPFTINGLTQGTNYNVLLRAVNSTGSGCGSAATNATTIIPTVPNVPTAVSASAGASAAYISFTAPSNDGGATITNYEYSTNNGSSWTALSPANTSTPLYITGLTSCTAYDVQVRAVNSAGSGPASAAVSVTPQNGQPVGVTWTSRSSAADNEWISVTYGNGLFVAVSTTGSGNRVMTSPDGITWTSRTSAADNSWQSVTYGNGLFVAVSTNNYGNRVMTSPDGINWTSRTPAAAYVWQSVTYGNGLFVAVSQIGSGNRVMTSPDGITWTLRTSAENNSWKSVTYGNGLFVAVSDDGTGNRVMTSPDGTTWTSRISAANNQWKSVTYGNGLFVAVSQSGSGNRVMTSPDGITWTPRTSVGGDVRWRSVTYGNGLFVAVADYGTNRVMTSPDGITWTSRTSAENNYWRSVTYGNGLFVAVGISGTNRVMTSSDAFAPGIPTISSITPSASTMSIAFTAPASAGFSAITNYAWTNNDGSSWTTRSPVSTTSPMVITQSGSASIRIRAVNAAGSSCPSAAVSVTSVMPTDAATAITRNAAISGGNTPALTNITQRGVVWHTATGPTVALTTKTEEGTGTGTYSSTLSSLSANTLYYIRSYVVHNGGTDVTYGEEKIFTTNWDMSSWMSSATAKTYGDAFFNLTPPSSNGRGRWTYGSSNTSVATISGNTVTIRGAGSTTITATQAAGSPYASATASYTLIVNGQTPVINLGIPITAQIKEAGTLTITPTSNSGGTVTLTLGSGSIVGVNLNPSGSSYTLSPVTTTGNLVFQASVPATGNYAAGSFSQTMDVTKNNPTITFTLSSSTVTYASGLTQTLTATGGGSSQPLTFTVPSGPGNITGGNILNITGPGDIVVKASQDGDATHNAAPDVVRTLTVNAGSPTIAGFSPVTATVGDLITITGDNLLGATAVTFGGTAAASYSVVNGTTITAVLANGHTGSVSVTTPSGAATRTGFRFKALWTGSSNTTFSTAGNWTGSRPPQTGDDIVFSPTAESDMELSAPLTAANVDFNGSSRTLNLGSHNLTVTGDLTMPGTITGTGRLIMGGSAAQTIAGGGSSLTDLEINNTGGGVTLSGTGGELIVTGRLRLTGGALNANGKLRLSSTASGTARVGATGSGASITGDVIAERFIQQNSNLEGTGRAWRLVSVPVTGAGTLRDFFMNGRAGQDLTLSATRSAETSNSGTPIVGHNYADATAATTAGTGAVRGFDWIGVANQVSSLRRYVGNATGGTFLSENVPDLSTTYALAEQGYMVFTRGDRTLEFPSTNNAGATTFRSTGTLKTGNQTVSVAPAATSMYTLVGNPYMSVLDLDALYTTNSVVIDPSFWFWDANLAGTNNQGGYVNVFKSGTTWVTNTGSYTNPQLIESGIAFFVDPAAGGTLTIQESHKSSSDAAGLAPFSTDPGDDHGRVYVRLERLSGSAQPQIIDGVMADFHTSFRAALGDQSDREKLVNGISRGALWMSRDNKMLSSQGLPWPKAADSSVVPIMMSGVGSQTLVLKVDPQGMRDRYVQAWLKDKVLKRQIEINMNAPTDYDFIGTGSAAWDSTRFELVFIEAGRPSTGVTLEPDGAAEQPSVKLYPNPSKSADVKLSLRAVAPGAYSVQVLDMTGRLVTTTTLNHRSVNGEYRILEGRLLSPGTYIIKLSDQNKQPKETLRLVVD
jgi:hypothetical protein